MCFMSMKEDSNEDSSELGLMVDKGTSEEHCKKNRKGKWYLDTACSRHMTGDKQLFKTVTKLDGGTVTFGDKSKENVIGVGRVSLSLTCDVDEVYLVDELGYNLLSISQLCDNDYKVIFLSHKDEALRNFKVFCKKVQRKKRHFVGKFESKAFVDTNPRLRNEQLPEDEEIFIVPKSINTGENTLDKVTDQQDQSTNSPTKNQGSFTTDPTNSIERSKY
nr:uncharacterized protein LOC104093463 [Nicotiana tomentosiformis]